jgi:hypothetical protein
MKTKIWIRTAAVLMLLHTIGHSFGTFSTASPNKKIAQITEEMAQNRFMFMGRSASLAIFFEGYGVVLILFLLLSSLLLWFIATDAETELGRKLLLLSIFFLVGLTIIEIIYCFPFFLTPLAVICTIVAFFKINKSQTVNT